MDRKGKEQEMKNRIVGLFAAALLAAGVGHAQDFSRIEIKTTKLTDTVYMLTGAGGNLGVAVGPDSVFVVDDQYAPMTEKITAAIAAITPTPVRFIVNTHWHGDHTGGNENFGKAGSLIVAHDNVRKRMSVEQFIEAFNMRTPPAPAVALPVVTFAQSVSFHLNGDEIRAIHMPNAHTDGDAIVHFVKSNVVHMGDIFFNGMYPFIDDATGGSVEGVIAACDKVAPMIDDRTKVIPGHGPLSNKAELKAYRDMLVTVSGRVKDMIKQGRKIDEITAANLTKDLDEKWGKGFIKGPKFVEMLAKAQLKR
jgi:glyoxylase-like metal-dependent hydrolase (beta-lactamase superfamily II)